MFIGIMVIIVIIVGYILITYNGLTKKKMRVEQAASGIEVYLTQRFDLIPNLVECVKAYCKHEESVFTEITKLRKEYAQNKDLQIGEELNKKYYGLMAVAENYPALQASDQFLNLQKNLSKIESQIQAARRIYNSEVTKLNISIDTFPSNLIARNFHFKKEKLFEADPNSRESISIELNEEKKA